MTVSDPTTVDRVMEVRSTGRVALVIIVPLTWYHGGEQQLEQLVAKVNTYVRYVDSGQCVKDYSQAANGIDILVMCMDEPVGPAGDLLLQIDQALVQKDLRLRYEAVFDENNLPTPDDGSAST